jgi:transcription-repair coupling factor (superfamily II helicase)
MPYLPEQLAHSNHPQVIICAQSQDAYELQQALQWFAPKRNVCYFPDWETLPYDHFSPHQDLISERLANLYHLIHQNFDVWITTASTALMRLPPIDHIQRHTFMLRDGESFDLQHMRAQLVYAGYAHVGQVLSPGEFSIRGSICDIFPMGAHHPYRIELLDTHVESIRSFNPESQRTLERLSEIRLLPAKEYPNDDESIQKFRQNYRAYFEGDPSKHTIYHHISRGTFSAGIDYFFPLFFDQTTHLFDLIPKEVVIHTYGPVRKVWEETWAHTQRRYEDASRFPERPVLAPGLLYLTPEDAYNTRPTVELPEYPIEALPNVAVERQHHDPYHALRLCLQHTPRVLLVAESLGRQEVLRQTLQEHHLKPHAVDSWQSFLDSHQPWCITVGSCGRGFWYDEHTLVITEYDLYHHVAKDLIHKHRSRKNKHGQRSIDWVIRDLAEIQEGDYIVHEEHGIGQYIGLVRLHEGESYETEMLHIAYKNNAALYVPITQLHLISRHSSRTDDHVSLHQLGSGQWQKTRKKAAEQARDTAAELLDLYAKRAMRAGHPHSVDHVDYESFSAGFGFEETPDQTQAIHAVLNDMASGTPMDRLVCGDVGFGKTEVALRAAFVAAMSGQQVVVLVPTTLLAEQHYHTFCSRFASWPIKIHELSRFRSKKEQQATLAALEDGTVDIVVGTHRLVQGDIAFKRLGLIIIDEEHRFGVRQKEQLKQLRAEVDVLTLTATPIPRTLSFALEGLRDFSVISTAPQRRLAVKTFVGQEHNSLIREAITREMRRGGQVYFLYNDVDKIQNMLIRLQEIVPEARIGIAHGQMKERELEQVMRDFISQRYNILLCSTIIETGIDVPNANTILIHRADRFGLAQLHQLRGRVGRSHHQAYAYLLIPEHITKDAEKRLDAISRLDTLGAGFTLAMHDMEIRGAGEILGESQSGEILHVGFSLYNDMLQHAVKSLKEGKNIDIDAPLGVHLEVNIHQPALLPIEYCPDTHERLLLYKRMAAASSEDDLKDIHEELIDRFGLLPMPVHALLTSHRIRLEVEPFAFQKVDVSDDTIILTFGKSPKNIDPLRLIQAVQNRKGSKLIGQEKVRFEYRSDDLDKKILHVREVLNNIKAIS